MLIKYLETCISSFKLLKPKKGSHGKLTRSAHGLNFQKKRSTDANANHRLKQQINYPWSAQRKSNQNRTIEL